MIPLFTGVNSDDWTIQESWKRSNIFYKEINAKRGTENPTQTHTPSKGADFETRNIDLFEGSLIQFWSTDVQNQNLFFLWNKFLTLKK